MIAMRKCACPGSKVVDGHCAVCGAGVEWDYNEATDAVVLHRRVETPSWDTKLRCSCGFEACTRREMAIHEFGQ